MRVLFFLLLQIATVNLIGQGMYNAAADSDSKATEILEALKNQVHNAPSVSLNFDFDIKYPGKESFATKGTIHQKQKLIKVDTDQQTTFTNDEGHWVILKEANEVEINDLDEGGGDVFLNPLEIVKFYESNDFVYAISEEFTEGELKSYDIEFKPLVEDSEYSKMRIRIGHQKDYRLENVKIFLKDGTKIELIIEDFNTAQEMDDSFFYFNESNYPNIHTEDLRF